MRREHVIARLRDFVSTQLLDGDTCRVDVDTPLDAWGVLDSVGVVDLLCFIEDDFGVEVPGERLCPKHFTSITSLTDMVLSLRPSA